MANSEVVEVILKLIGSRQFQQDAEKSAKAVGDVGKASEKSGKQSGSAWKSVAKWGGAAAVAYGAQRFLRGAISTTEELGQSTLQLNRVTGMGVKQSSEWAATLKAREVPVKQFQLGLVMLSRQMTKTNDTTGKNAQKIAELNAQYELYAHQGGKKAQSQMATIQKQIIATTGKSADAVSMWQKLGVSMDDVRKGRTEQVLEQISTAFSKMKNPAERAAMAQKLFGRGALSLAPLLFKGGQAIRDQLKTAGKYVDFNAKNAKQIKQEIADQRELKLAYMGVQVSLGKALLPVMLDLSQVILKIVNVLQPFIKSGMLVKVMIVALVAAFVAWKVMSLVMTAVNWGLAASTWAWIGAIALVIIILAAVVLGVIYAWKHFKWFRDAIYAVWNALKFAFNWAKQNWPLLVGILGGPIGLAVAFIITHWDTVKNAFISAFNWVKKNWPLLLGILGGPVALAVVLIVKNFGRLKTFVVGVWHAIKQAAIDAWNWLKTLPDKLKGLIKKIPGMGILGKALGLAKKIPGVGTALGWAGLQHGGTITQPGGVIVGEAGPELISLPAAASVVPLGPGSGVGTSGVYEIHTHIWLDRRQIAEAVGQFAADKAARR